MLDMLSVQGNVKYIWERRKEILFWRGRDSNKNRLNLIKISKTHPELFNASLTNFFFFKDEEDIYGPRSEHISFFKFFDVSNTQVERFVVFSSIFLFKYLTFLV